MKTVFFVLSFVVAAAAMVATHISWISPQCRRNYLPIKMVCSCGFLLTGLFAAAATGFTRYGLLILAALFCGLWGDFFLEWKQAKYFYAGVVCFAIGHGFYIYNFLTADVKSKLTLRFLLITFAILLVLNIVSMQLEKIKFKGFQNVMMAYAAVLLVMVTVAIWRCYADYAADAHRLRGLLTAIGAILFLVSDTFLAAQLYGKSHSKHPEAWVLYTYFPAQTLIALGILFA